MAKKKSPDKEEVKSPDLSSCFDEQEKHDNVLDLSSCFDEQDERTDDDVEDSDDLLSRFPIIPLDKESNDYLESGEFDGTSNLKIKFSRTTMEGIRAAMVLAANGPFVAITLQATPLDMLVDNMGHHFLLEDGGGDCMTTLVHVFKDEINIDIESLVEGSEGEVTLTFTKDEFLAEFCKGYRLTNETKNLKKAWWKKWCSSHKDILLSEIESSELVSMSAGSEDDEDEDDGEK